MAELEVRPLDVADRRDAAQQDVGLGCCNITKCCSPVCPDGIHLNDNGIIPLMERVCGPEVRSADLARVEEPAPAAGLGSAAARRSAPVSPA